MERCKELMCRACAHKCDEIDAVEASRIFKSKETIYTELTTLETSDDDDLPKCLCSKCSVLLEQFKSFKEICIQSDQHFRCTILSRVKEETGSNVDLLEPKDENLSASSDNEVGAYSVNSEDIPLKSKRTRKRTKHFDQNIESKNIPARPKRMEKKTKRPKLRTRNPTKAFAGQSIIKESKSTVKKLMVYECLQEGCGQKFITQANLDDHHIEHNVLFDFDFYQNTTSDNQSVPAHDEKIALAPSIVQPDVEVRPKKKTVRNTEKKRKSKFKCEIEGCGREFINENKYDVHVKRHRGENSFICNICNRPLASKCTLKRHLRIHENIDKRSHTCNECHRTFSNRESFLSHMTSHKGQEHICEQCGKCCNSVSNLRIHRSLHDSAVPEVCKDCQKTFRSKMRLFSHRHQCHTQAIDKLPVRCLICNKLLKNKKMYQKHCKDRHTVYTTDPIFDCQICSGKFKTKDTLRIHLKIHANERKFVCPECPKSFNSSGMLKKHGYFHSGERPVHCEICDKGFYQKCALDIHMNVHKRQWIAEGQQGITLHVYPRNKKKPVEWFDETE